MDATRRYGFEFVFSEDTPRVPRGLRQLSNRRAAYRVRPTSREPIFARVWPPGRAAPPPPRTALAKPLDPEPGQAPDEPGDTDVEAPGVAPEDLVQEPMPEEEEVETPSDVPDPRSLARIRDISVRGAAVLVDPDLDLAFTSEDNIHVAFYLPGANSMQQLFCTIRRREREGHQVLYGLEYHRERTPDFDRQQVAIGRYVMRRQREEWPLDHSFDR